MPQNDVPKDMNVEKHTFTIRCRGSTSSERGFFWKWSCQSDLFSFSTAGMTWCIGSFWSIYDQTLIQMSSSHSEDENMFRSPLRVTSKVSIKMGVDSDPSPSDLIFKRTRNRGQNSRWLGCKESLLVPLTIMSLSFFPVSILEIYRASVLYLWIKLCIFCE